MAVLFAVLALIGGALLAATKKRLTLVQGFSVSLPDTMPRVRSSFALIRGIGLAGIVRALGDRAWSTNISFGLACDLARVPPARPTAVAVHMRETDEKTFTGFHAERERVAGDDYMEIDQRLRMCASCVVVLYCAFDPEGAPIFAQWLINSRTQFRLRRMTHGQFPELSESEVLAEGGYTFVDFRRLGAMGEGLRQVLCIARENGAERCVTFVTVDNLASLRGVANAGFELEHVRATVSRLGRRRVIRRAPTPEERTLWEQAITPRT